MDSPRNEGKDYFEINEQTGEIFTKVVFDREKQAAYALEVEAHDGSPSARPNSNGLPNTGDPPQLPPPFNQCHTEWIQQPTPSIPISIPNSFPLLFYEVYWFISGGFWGFTVTKFIRIGIADKNDNPPFFDKALYEAEVDENEDIQHTVLTVTAKDLDECKSARTNSSFQLIEAHFARSYQSCSMLESEIYWLNLSLGIRDGITWRSPRKNLPWGFQVEFKLDRSPLEERSELDWNELLQPYLLTSVRAPGFDWRRPLTFQSQTRVKYSNWRVSLSPIDSEPNQRRLNRGARTRKPKSWRGNPTENCFLFLFFLNAASKIRYEITRGNLGGAFAVKNMTGAIYVAGPLDYETRKRVSGPLILHQSAINPPSIRHQSNVGSH